MPNAALPVAVAGFFALVFVAPLVRLRRRTGEWGVVFARRADPFQSWMGALLGAWLAAAAGWSVAYGLAGPRALGVWRAPAAVGAAGWVMIAAGLAIIVVAQAQMGVSWRIGIDDRPTPLATRGLYRLVRNPIYSGMLLALAGAVLVSPCAWTIMAWPAVAQVVAMQTRLEERHLLAVHGARYRSWGSRVGRFVPWVGRLR